MLAKFEGKVKVFYKMKGKRGGKGYNATDYSLSAEGG